MILAGDIGGTKTRLAVFERMGRRLRNVREAVFESTAHASFEAIVTAFLAASGRRRVHAACIGVAGPVIDGRSQTTNLAWTVDARALSALLGIPRAKLLNDLEATAYGVLHLDADDLLSLTSGVEPHPTGNLAVIAAGTGLGEAVLYCDGTHFHPLASEGGHVDFAPHTEQEIALFRYLQHTYGAHVSYERILSGPGLHNVYRFLSDATPAAAPPAPASDAGDPAAHITEAAIARTDPLAVAALELFCSIYGAEAGNLALKCLALGGVFVAGGIAPKILPFLQNGTFLQSFTAKGRFADLLRRIPVHVVVNPRAPLIGAAHYALRL